MNQQQPNKFYEVVIHFPENLEMKKEDLKTLYEYLPLHRSEKYLIVDRLFIDLKNSTSTAGFPHHSGTPLDGG